MYLVRSESNARLGNTAAAVADLNTLLIKRWKTGTYIPYLATDATAALAKILVERRKELVMRGLRWLDLRRLNIEDAFKKTLYRKLSGTMYELPPGDKRYTYPIPDDVMSFNPSLQQNPR